MKNILYIVIALIFLTSCKTQLKEVPVEIIKEVPVETVKTEYVSSVIRDTVYEKEILNRWQEGDTVYIYKEVNTSKSANKSDTILVTDTIPKLIKVEVPKVVNQEVIKEVNKITWWQKILMWIGAIMILVTSGFVIYKIKKK